MAPLRRILCSSIIILFSATLSSTHTFHSRDLNVRRFITACQSNTTIVNAADRCKATLHCVISASPPDYNAGWSVGASILAVIPTIVGLMSNSIDEISVVAEESLPMAILLSLSSVTTFTPRFTQTIPADAFEYHPGYLDAKKAHILELLRKNARSGHPLQGRILHRIAGVFIAILVVATWYMLSEITKYGVVEYSCTSLNVILWAGLSQVLTITNLLLRRYSFKTLVIPISDSRQRALVELLQREWKKRTSHQTKSLLGGNLLAGRIVIRCPSTGSIRWIIQNTVAVANCMLYAFGTATLAGITLVSATESIKVLTVLTLSAGFGRMVANWIVSPARPGKRSVVVDVPKRHMQGITETFSKNGIKITHHQNLDFGDRPLQIHWRLHARPRIPLESPC